MNRMGTSEKTAEAISRLTSEHSAFSTASDLILHRETWIRRRIFQYPFYGSAFKTRASSEPDLSQ